MKTNDYIASLGILALGSRFKRLSELCMQRMQSYYTSAGIAFDPGHFPVMHYLYTHKEASLAELAEVLGLSHAAISQRISKLHHEKLIDRRYPKKDKRTCMVSLTKEGKSLANSLTTHWKIIQESLEECLADDAERLLHSLHRIESVMVQDAFVQSSTARLKAHQSCDITIIPFHKKYIAEFAALNEEWLNHYFHIEPIDKKVLHQPIKNIIKPGGEIWFAQRGTTILGCYALLVAPDGGLEFSKFAVTPAARGQQIGKALMLHAIARARARGSKTLTLYTHSRLTAACTLYRKLGFRDVKISGCMPYQRCDTVMELSLHSHKIAA